MLPITKENIIKWSNLGYRSAFGEAILDIGDSYVDVVVATADLAGTTRVIDFADKFPNRFFQVGIAEQNLIGIAAGLAACGKIPVVTTFATFATMRSCEQIRTDVAYADFNVKIVGVESGVGMATLGMTHCAIEDIGIMRSIPNLVILCPADGLEIIKAVRAAVEYKGPVYIRLGGGGSLPLIYKSDYEFEIGKAVTLRDGRDGTIIATGTMVSRAVEAADILSRDSINMRVINMHTVKPLDEEVVLKAADETKNVITLEEHNKTGGLGAAVAEVMAQYGSGTLTIMGLPDEFAAIAPYKIFLERCGLTPENIAKTMKQKLGLK